MQGNFTLHDMVVKIFTPPLPLNKQLYLTLVDHLSEYYNTHNMSPEKFTFSLSSQKVATVMPHMSSVVEFFDAPPQEVKNRLFKILNQIVVATQSKSIDYFDLVLSAIYALPGNSYSFEPIDYLGNSFLKQAEWSIPEAEECTTGIQWFFRKAKKSYTLRLEPHRGRPNSIFVEMLVMFPQESVSLAEMKLLVEEEYDYFTQKIFPFISTQLELQNPEK